MKINQKNLEIFWKYIKERHSIYKKKSISKISPPWTQDIILIEYKFTNVFRDLDTGTKYVIEYILPNCGSQINELFNLIIYRIYNKISTFEGVGIQDINNFKRDIFESRLRNLVSEGEKVFTNAFIVSGYSFLSGEGDKISRTTKIIEIISMLLKEKFSELESSKNSQKTFEIIKEMPGIGNFLAYQIAVDFGYINRDLFNENEFVIAGPGCKNGIDRIFENRGNLSYEECIKWLEDNQEEGFSKIRVNSSILFEDRKIKRLNLMAIENCLCEISKYLKAKYSEGRPRNKYYYEV